MARLASRPRRQGRSAFKSRRPGNRVPPNCVERAPERRSPTGIDRREAVETTYRRPTGIDRGMAPFSARTPEDRRSNRVEPPERRSRRRPPEAVETTCRRLLSRDAKGTPTSGRHSGPQGRGGVDPNRRNGSFLGAYPGGQGGAQVREPRTPELRGARAGAPVSDRHRPPEAVETTYRQSRRIAGTAWIADLWPVLPVGVGTARRRRNCEELFAWMALSERACRNDTTGLRSAAPVHSSPLNLPTPP